MGKGPAEMIDEIDSIDSKWRAATNPFIFCGFFYFISNCCHIYLRLAIKTRTKSICIAWMRGNIIINMTLGKEHTIISFLSLLSFFLATFDSNRQVNKWLQWWRQLHFRRFICWLLLCSFFRSNYYGNYFNDIFYLRPFRVSNHSRGQKI